MNKLGTWIVAIGAVVGLANILMFAVWWNLIEVTASAPKEAGGYTIDVLALNITILEIVLALVGFFLAGLGLFGYSEIKNTAISRAIDAAEKEARQEASAQMSSFIREMAKSRESEQIESPGTQSVVPPTPGQAEKAKDE